MGMVLPIVMVIAMIMMSMFNMDVATGQSYCANTDCQSLLEQGLGTEDGLYWIAPYDVEPHESILRYDHRRRWLDDVWRC